MRLTPISQPYSGQTAYNVRPRNLHPKAMPAFGSEASNDANNKSDKKGSWWQRFKEVPIKQRFKNGWQTGKDYFGKPLLIDLAITTALTVIGGILGATIVPLLGFGLGPTYFLVWSPINYLFHFAEGFFAKSEEVKPEK